MFLRDWLFPLSIVASSPRSLKHVQEAPNGRMAHMHTCPISPIHALQWALGLLPLCATGNSALSILVQAFGYGPSSGMATPCGNCIFNFFVEPSNFSTVAALLKEPTGEPTGVFTSAPPTHPYVLFLNP